MYEAVLDLFPHHHRNSPFNHKALTLGLRRVQFAYTIDDAWKQCLVCLLDLSLGSLEVGEWNVPAAQRLQWLVPHGHAPEGTASAEVRMYDTCSIRPIVHLCFHMLIHLGALTTGLRAGKHP